MTKIFRTAAVLVLALLTLGLCGCANYIDLADRAIVQAIGIDYLPDKKAYRISMQYFNQSSEGGQNQIDKTQDNVLKSVGEGDNVFSAAKNASLLTGKDLLLSENRLIIIGKELRKYDLEQAMEFFIGNFHSHPQAYVAAAENTAEELLDIRFKEGSTSSQRLSDLIRNAASEGRCRYSYPYQVMTMLCTGTRSAFLPLLKAAELETDVTIPKQSGNDSGKDGKEQSKNSETTIILDGGIVFRDGVELFSADAEVSTAVFFLTDRVSEYSFTVPLEKYAKPNVTLNDISRNITVTEKDGEVTFNVFLKASGKIGSRGNIKEGDITAVRAVTETAEKELERIVENSVISVAGKGCDVFGLENALRRCCNKFYNENKDRIGGVIADSDCSVSVDIDIFSLGLNTA